MSFNQYQDIKVVHFEVSSKCNALCPQCARSVFGSKVNPNLNQKDLKLNEVKKIDKPEEDNKVRPPGISPFNYYVNAHGHGEANHKAQTNVRNKNRDASNV